MGWHWEDRNIRQGAGTNSGGTGIDGYVEGHTVEGRTNRREPLVNRGLIVDREIVEGRERSIVEGYIKEGQIVKGQLVE